MLPSPFGVRHDDVDPADLFDGRVVKRSMSGTLDTRA